MFRTIHNLHMMAATQVEAAAEEVVTQVETAAAGVVAQGIVGVAGLD